MTEWETCVCCNEEWEWPKDFTAYGAPTQLQRKARGLRATNCRKICNACYLERWGRTVYCSIEGCKVTKQTRRHRGQRIPWLCGLHLREALAERRCRGCGAPTVRTKKGRQRGYCDPCLFLYRGGKNE